MKKLLQYLFEHQLLNRKEAHDILSEISEGKYNDAEIAAFLTVYRMRGITVDELIGFRDCLREKCISIDFSDFDTIDLCGTGGDAKDTFNISTLASFVVAGAGYKVAKHGNYGVSSISGSSNVLEHLGYKFKEDESLLKSELDNAGITFLHAPLFHPLMKKVAPIRRALGVSTFFNMLGPMANPSFPKKQMVGVFSLQLQRYYKYIYEQESTSFRIVHGLDGFDEISLTDNAKIIAPDKEIIVEPTQFINKKLNASELFGGNSVTEAGHIFLNVLKNKGTAAQQAVVCANAAIALQCYNPQKSIAESYAFAQESLQSGKALQSFQKLVSK